MMILLEISLAISDGLLIWAFYRIGKLEQAVRRSLLLQNTFNQSTIDTFGALIKSVEDAANGKI